MILGTNLLPNRNFNFDYRISVYITSLKKKKLPGIRVRSGFEAIQPRLIGNCFLRNNYDTFLWYGYHRTLQFYHTVPLLPSKRSVSFHFHPVTILVSFNPGSCEDLFSRLYPKGEILDLLAYYSRIFPSLYVKAFRVVGKLWCVCV